MVRCRVSSPVSPICTEDTFKSDLTNCRNWSNWFTPRVLVPTMSALNALTSVNFLTADAIATSMVLEAAVVITTPSALFRRAGTAAGVEVRVLSRP